MEQHHGNRTRGLSQGLAAVPQGPLFEGRFGRVFRGLPVFEVEHDPDAAQLHAGRPHLP